MVYGEVYVPQIAEGLRVRIGRFTAIPDIESQLAPSSHFHAGIGRRKDALIAAADLIWHF
jgi:hypothetical protein